MTYFILLFLSHLSKSLMVAIGDKNRIITKPRGSSTLFYNSPGYLSIEKMFFAS